MKMKKTGPWIVGTILTASLLLAETRPTLPRHDEGDPFIYNYHPEEYRGSAQVFNSIEDNLGQVYFATNEGVLIYNGQDWKRIELPNRSRVFHIQGALPGRIFVSGTAEFGQLALSAEGETFYESFLERLPEAERDFQDVFYCYALRDHRFFITQDRIFCLGEREAHVIRCLPRGGIQVDQKLFIIQQGQTGLFSLDDGGLTLVKGSDALGQLYVLRRVGESEVLLITDQGRFVFDTNHKGKAPLFRKAHGPLADQAGDLNLSMFLRLKPDRYVVGRPGQSLQLIDEKGRLLNEIGKENGLLSNNIYHASMDRFGNLWVSQNVGISYIELSSPLTRFSSERGLEGMVVSAIAHQDSIYASTFYGLHRKRTGQGKFTHIPGTETACFGLYISRNRQLYVADANRLLRISGDQTEELARIDEYIYAMVETPHRPGLLYLGHSGGLSALRLSADGSRVEPAHDIDGLAGPARTLLCDDNGDLWISIEYQGLYKLAFSDRPEEEPQLTRLTGTAPLEKEEDVFIALYHKKLYMSSSSGYYRLADLKGPPFAFQALRMDLPPSKQTGIFLHDPTGTSLWFHRDQQLSRILLSEEDRITIDRTPFAKVNAASVEMVTTSPDGCSWLCTNNGLFRFDDQKKKEYQAPFRTIIHKVVANNSQTFLAASTPDLPATAGLNQKSPVELPFRQNGLDFYFCAVYFEHATENQYQFKLEGFDENWSPWSNRSSKEYTNLPHGAYRFLVRSRNIFGTVGTTDSFSFLIDTPWFLHPLAFLAYLLAAVGILRLSVSLYTRRLTRRQRVLEKAVSERTREVEEQKRQIAEKNRILNELATKDDLTGIANHRRIMDHYRKEWQRAVRERQPISLLLADIDNFKEYNDSFGHLAGDQCLKKVASAFAKNALRPADLAGRYGGEEFMMILPQTDASGAAKVAENVRKAVVDLKIRHKEGVSNPYITISIGYVSATPKQGMKTEQLISLADQALYASKREGKNRVTLADFPPGD